MLAKTYQKLIIQSRASSSQFYFSKFNKGIKQEAGESNKFNPFSVRLESNAKEQPSAISRIKSFFSSIGGNKESTPTPKPSSVDEIYQNLKKQQSETITEKDKLGEMEKRKKITEMIDKNINRKYFSEKKCEEFFTQCFSLKDPQRFKEEDPKIQEFIEKDIKMLVQSVREPQNLVEFTKFAVLFRLSGEDPELFELIADQVKKNVSKMTTDQLLIILVNFAHSLSTESQEMFDVVNNDLVYRLDSNFNANSKEIYIQPEDFPKILTTMLDHKQFSHDLKQSMMDYLKENVHYFNYQILSDLAVIYASRMDIHYKKLFFEKTFKDKFIKELRYLDQETFYKIIWSLIKAKAIGIDEQAGSEWAQIKEAVVAKVKDFDPKTLTEILVLATVAKGAEGAESMSGDLWDQVEPEVIMKMKVMQLSDLLNLLWSSQEVKRGSNYFFEKLEEEILARIRSVKDEDLQLLVECLVENGQQDANEKMENIFSEKFIQLLLRVIKEKKDKFQLKTLVHLIWAFAKSPELSNNPEIQQLLIELRDDQRMRQSLGGLLQKSQCILLWAYSRDEGLFDKDFLKQVCKAMLSYDGPKFELDNFDLLLIVQAISHLERSEFGSDPVYMQEFHQLAMTAETFVVKNFPSLNIHEFTTIMLFYLRGEQHDLAVSRQLLEKMLTKLTLAADQFNELQLQLFLKSLISFAVRNKSRYDRSLFEPAVNMIDKELLGIQKEKEFMMSEDRIRRAIRERLRDQYGIGKDEEEGVAKPFKAYGTEHDEKLEREMPKNAVIDEEEDIIATQKEEEIKEVEAAQVRLEVDQEEKVIKEKEQVQVNKEEEEFVGDQTDSKLKKYLLKMKKGNNLRK